MRIGLTGKNSVEYVEQLLRIWNSGNSAVLNCDTPPSSVFGMLADTGAAQCFADRTSADRYCDTAPPSFEMTCYPTEYGMPCVLPESVRDMYTPRYDDTEAVVIYSSGTTGKRKGISLSHRAISSNADSIIDYMNISESDCLYLNKKLSHISSLTGELLVALKTGADIVLSPLAVPPRVAFRTVTGFGVTVLCCNPYLLNLYAEETERTGRFPESVRTVYTSGDAVSLKDIERARKTFGCPVYNVYGQSECGPRISAQREGCCTGNSAGRPVKNVEVRTDEQGEILVKTNALFSGYTNSGYTPGEWHRTGDLGYIGKEGELYVTGRTDSMIITGAHNVYPETVEKAVTDNSTANDCLVYMKDCVLVCDYVSDKEIDSVTVIKTLRQQLLPYEVPKRFRKVTAIPRNTNGKKMRF